MWCLFILIHHILTFSEWNSIGHDFLESSNNFYRACGAITLVLVIVTLLRPKSPMIFAACLTTWSTLKFGNLPFVPNHIVLALITNLALITAIFYHQGFRKSSSKEVMIRVYDQLAPFLRLMLIILYFFTVFHKLNWDYFNPQISCGTVLYEDIKEHLSFLPEHVIFIWLAIVGTLVIELLIPILLLIKGQVIKAILLGFAFHFVLSLHPNSFIFSFSAEVYAFYILFLPGSVILLLFDKVQSISRYIYQLSIPIKSLIAVLILGLLGVLNGINFTEGLYEGLKQWLHNLRLYWYIWNSLLIAGALMLFSAQSDPLSRMLPKVRFNAFAIFPLLLFLNGSTPYLGIKTATNFSMFSNLKIVGEESNHMIIRRTLPLLPYDAQLVEIVESNTALFEDVQASNEYITLFEFRRRIKSNLFQNSARIIIKYDGEESTVILPEDDQPSNSVLAEKFLIYRGVPKSEVCHCQW